MDWRFETTWITGATSGIGEAAARLLAAPGRRLVLSGRNPERLDSVGDACRAAGATVVPLRFDFADAAARRAAADEAAAMGIDAFLGNAGISQRARAEDAPATLVAEIMTVDFLAHVDLALAILPRMLARGAGAIVAVSSVAGLAPVPLRSAYNAAKAAQLAWFGTLANEVHGRGVTVTLAIPGFVRTSVSQNARTADGGSYGTLDPNQARGVAPERAAAEILAAAAGGRRRVYTGMTAKLRLLVALSRFAPGLLDRVLARAEVT